MIHLSRAVNVIAVVLFASVLVSFGPSASSVAQEQGSRPVVVADVKGAIGVGTTLLLEEALAVARRREAELLVLQIDTPGGLVSATREVIQKILASRIPIAVYVSPSGARAASAGTYIAYAAHVSAMAPGTHLGAATPISLGPARPTAPGQPPPRQPNQPADNAPSSAAERKVLNDAISYLKSLAQLRGRNVDWAEKAVRDAATLTADEALKAGVVDFVAKDLSGLLRQIDGREVQTAVGARRLVVRNAIVVPVEPTWKTQIISTLTNPNIAFILLMIGFYGIIFEFWSPGLTGPGVVGGISLLVALMALSTMPVSYAGAALLLLGLVLMVGEAFAPGVGILGIGGVVAFTLGALFLFDPSGSDIDLVVALPVVLSATLTSALLLIGFLGFLARVRRKAVVTGAEELLSLSGRVVKWGEQDGQVLIHGEIWAAKSAHPLVPGQRVLVAERQGLTLIVYPSEERS